MCKRTFPNDNITADRHLEHPLWECGAGNVYFLALFNSDALLPRGFQGNMNY